MTKKIIRDDINLIILNSDTLTNDDVKEISSKSEDVLFFDPL